MADLIERKFGTQLGLTPQKPLQRAYQHDPEAIERWRCETYPETVRQAKLDGGKVFFWDKSGFRGEAVHGRTWGVRGQTPVVNAKGGFWHCTYEGGLTAELFVSLLRKMMRYRAKPVHLVVDRLPVHKTKL